MGAGHCPWGGCSDRIVCNMHRTLLSGTLGLSMQYILNATTGGSTLSLEIGILPPVVALSQIASYDTK